MECMLSMLLFHGSGIGMYDRWEQVWMNWGRRIHSREEAWLEGERGQCEKVEG